MTKGSLEPKSSGSFSADVKDSTWEVSECKRATKKGQAEGPWMSCYGSLWKPPRGFWLILQRALIQGWKFLFVSAVIHCVHSCVFGGGERLDIYILACCNNSLSSSWPGLNCVSVVPFPLTVWGGRVLQGTFMPPLACVTWFQAVDFHSWGNLVLKVVKFIVFTCIAVFTAVHNPCTQQSYTQSYPKTCNQNSLKKRKDNIWCQNSIETWA